MPESLQNLYHFEELLKPGDDDSALSARSAEKTDG
jgi:hypothetical protein